MILKKGDDDLGDSPPPYDGLAPPPGGVQGTGDRKYELGTGNEGSRSPGPSETTYGALSPRTKGWFSWRGEKNSKREVKETIQSLVSHFPWICENIELMDDCGADSRRRKRP